MENRKKLVIDHNTIYEIDLECKQKREERKKKKEIPLQIQKKRK